MIRGEPLELVLEGLEGKCGEGDIYVWPRLDIRLIVLAPARGGGFS